MPGPLDAVAAQLRAWRAAAGSPSFASIANRIGVIRGRAPSRITVYDCFREGRRRIDVDLAVDIATALRIPDGEIPAWRAQVIAAHHPVPHETPVTMQRGRPTIIEPFTHRLDGILPTRPVLVTGMPGVGKTQAAFDFARRLIARDHATDVLVLGLRGDGSAGAPTAESIVDAARSVLGIQTEGTLAERARVVGDSLRAQRLLLVIDDASHPDQLDPILPALTGVPVIVTSRVVFDSPGMDHLPLAPWEPRELAELLGGIIGRDRVLGDPDATERIISIADGSPLAVAALAGRIRDGWTLADVAEDLQERSDRVHDAVASSVAATYPALDDASRRVLRLTAMQPASDLSLPQLAALADLDEPEAGEAVTRLEAAYLVTRGSTGRVGMHALVRAFATDRAREEDPPRVRHQALDRLAERMIAEAWAVTIAHAGPAATGGSRFGIEPAALSEDEARAWGIESAPLAAQLVRVRQERAPQHLIDFAESGIRTFQLSGRAKLAMALHSEAEACAERIGDVEGQARAALGAGTFAVRLGDAAAADHLLRSRELARRAGSPRLEMQVSNSLAVHRAQSGATEEALAQFRQTLGIALENDFSDVAPMLYDNIGIVQRRLGDLDGALESGQRALRAALDAGHLPQAANISMNLADLRVARGENAEAERVARQAIDLSERTDSPIIRAHALTNLGVALAARGERAEAFAALEESIAIARSAGWPELEASGLSNLGHAILDGADPDASGPNDADPDAPRAREAFERAATLAGDYPMEHARALHGLARLEQDPARARSFLTRALEVLGDASAPEAAAIREALDALAPAE